jgi:rfaE bifunctional protein kinase chain/domain
MNFLYPTSAEIRSVMKRLRGARVGVLGDFCVDSYWWIDAQSREVSVETGKPVRLVRRQRYTPGGAGTIVNNLCALGVERVMTFGVIGADPFGQELLQMLGKLNVDTSGMLAQPKDWDTPVYGKPILNDEELERLDFGAFNVIQPETWERLLAALRAANDKLDLVIVNQQLPRGWCDEARATAMAKELNRAWPRRHIVDSRDFARCFDDNCRKLNEREASKLIGKQIERDEILGDDEAHALGATLSKSSGETQFLTRGARGLMACDRGAVTAIPGVFILGPIDSVGAGDAVNATLAACLSAGIDKVQAACLANLAASVTVQKLKQTGTANEEELVQAASKVAYVYRPSLAGEPRLARYWKETDIEIIDEPPRGPVRRAVFDHDGTISTLRQGWEKVMEPVMMQAILGGNYATVDSARFRRVQARVREYIEQSTGIQTLVQMDALVEMVREFGLVPESERLDAQGYKKVYNDALMAMVNERLERLERKELDVADFVIKGAVEFLTALSQAGVRMHLASGTDEEDVAREAKALGYAHLFSGGICGAKLGSRACSKEEVIESILEQNTVRDGTFLVAGDGPVEIREARRHDGWALGVASHEERRFGLNEAKRRRLIRAGAHTVAPDFSQWRQLVKLITTQR